MTILRDFTRRRWTPSVKAAIQCSSVQQDFVVINRAKQADTDRHSGRARQPKEGTDIANPTKRESRSGLFNKAGRIPMRPVESILTGSWPNFSEDRPFLRAPMAALAPPP